MMGKEKDSLHQKTKRSVVYHLAAMHHHILYICFHTISHLKPPHTEISNLSGIAVGTINTEKSASLTAYKGE
jgi:hypothetical protein